MKYTIAIVFVAFLSCSLAAPAADYQQSVIEHYTSDVQPDGYTFDFRTSDGQMHSASGVLKNAGTENESIAVTGSYSFVADDGQTYTVNYIADENGFQPQGAHLPDNGISH
ncbi:larval cuticle protein 65Ag1 [Drosophila grimshawi]|uniref:GH15836 n=1 Tax=Drosophila grimshawi TaxID=7222 RepID=B4IZT7_DROGR|nr:larval cuticle protein 65Ag1 [Drosophila grimshawi]EDV95672.1 GH15836 [Drosophila grimshawi]